MFLLGSVFSHKKLNASNFWNFAAPTTLTLSIPDASVFQFLNGNLFSEYLDASTFTYSFSQARTPVSAPLLSDAGFFGFTLGAHLMPISANYTKLWISLTPFPLDTLLSDHPLAPSPTFPGLNVLEGDIPLGPASSGPPLTKNWGCPISPAILLGVHCPEYIVQITLSRVKCPDYIVQSTVSRVQCPEHIVLSTLSRVHFTEYIV